MSLQSGTRLGPYEILGSLGSGGMGEVYRAQDPRFGRQVAIKVLPSHLSMDQDRLARFEQEARAVGVLNHPNILSVYDIGRENGSPYLVSELLDGETLRHKIGKHGVAHRKAIEYALQMARGLSAAHEKGIVHRDLKPENIFITKDGRVKILDFGLAKLTQREVPSGQLTQLPTTPGTEPGTVLGTMGYMSPEQVRGKHADHRSDIFTFGAILYEMLTGQKAFRGETAADTMSEILHKEPPDFAQSGSNISPALARIVHHCIEKDPEQRFQSATDIAFAIESLSSASDSKSQLPIQTSRRINQLPLKALFALTILALGIVSFLYYKSLHQPKQTLYASIEIPDSRLFIPDSGGMALSADGTQLAFVIEAPDGKREIWIRRMDQPMARRISETDGGAFPFFSPDGKWIAFSANGKLRKVNLTGGLAQTICDAESSRGGTWGADGTILFSPGAYGPLFKVSAAGGTPVQVTPNTQVENESHRWPHFLPDGNRFVFTSMNGKEEGIFAGALNSQSVHRISTDASNAAYIPEGYLLFHREGNLVAHRYNVDQERLEGEPIVILPDRVNYDPTKRTGNFTVSMNGVIAYWAEFSPLARLNFQERSRRTTDVALLPDSFIAPRISPDGTKIAVQHYDRQNRMDSLWIYDRSSARTTRFNLKKKPFGALVWAPDETHGFYSTGHEIIKKSLTDNTEETIYESKLWLNLSSVSPDGKWLSCAVQSPTGKYDLWLIPTDGSKKHKVFLEAGHEESNGMFCPDGKWMAYTTDASGKFYVQVRPVQNSNREWQISDGPGIVIRWRNDGKEIYYFRGENVYAAEVNAEEDFQVIGVREIFTFPLNSIGGDISPDGQQMLNVLAEKEAVRSPFRIVVNWTEVLKKN